MTEPKLPTPEEAQSAGASQSAALTATPHAASAARHDATATNRHFGDSQDSVVEYRSPSGWAIAALALGLCSPVAMVGPLGWIVPAAAVVVGTVAIVRLGVPEQVKIGRRAALAGLSLGLVFIAAAPVALVTSQWCLEAEAHKVAVEWFDYLRHGEPHKASQLGVSTEVRQPLDDTLWAYYREHPEAKRELEDFARQPLVRALLALGEAAQVRFYETQQIERGSRRDELVQVYAVTYQDDDKKKSFFVRLSLDRSADPVTGRGRWRVNGAGGGIRPKSWSG